MTSWQYVVGPAFATALLINLDARFIGPYFTLSSLIMSNEGLNAGAFYTDKHLKNAFLRRLFYPLIMGFFLVGFVTSKVDIGFTGGLSALLLIWPALFIGFPVGISRHRWEPYALYFSFVVSYAFLAVAGSTLRSSFDLLRSGESRSWMRDQFTTTLLGWVAAIMLTGVHRYIFRRLARGNK